MLITFVSLFLLMVFTAGIYNKLVSLRNRSDEAWSGIDVQLKRRHDLIPNLVECVKGYAKHENETLEKVVLARNKAIASNGIEEKIAAEGVLGNALKGVFALAEAYPDLKANQNFLDLQNSLDQVEGDLQMARRYYNAVVRDLNTACESFPSFLIASQCGFRKREYFEAEISERENVSMQF